MTHEELYHHLVDDHIITEATLAGADTDRLVEIHTFEHEEVYVADHSHDRKERTIGVAEMSAFIIDIAKIRLDGEGHSDYVLENDDAVAKLAEIVDHARRMTGFNPTET